MEDVQPGDDLDVVGHVGERAGPPAAVEVGDERRAADGTEHHPPTTEGHVAKRVAGMEGELGRRPGDERLDEAVVEADAAGRPIDGGTGPGKHVDGAGAEDLDPDLAEDPERRPVDRLDLVRAQDLDRRERVLDRSPGQLAEPRRRSAAAAMAGVDGHGDLMGRWSDRG